VRLRRTAWLLSVLFGVAAFFGTPAASIAIPRASYTVVCPDKAGDKQAPRQEIAESREAFPRPPAGALPVIPKYDARTPAALLDPALFQRPPPSVISL
jgi:hypothetical protein